MTIGKNKLKQINAISFVHEVLITLDYGRSIAEAHWVNLPPDMWSIGETHLYDMLCELERKVKNETLEILTQPKS